MDVPREFRPLFRTSPVLDLIGPLYCRGEGKQLVLGLGHTMAFASTPPASLVTASMTLDFAGTATIGDWVEAGVDILKQGSRLAFANCYITVGETRIARPSAVFLVGGQLDGSASV